jgi:hypothetical protein
MHLTRHISPAPLHRHLIGLRRYGVIGVALLALLAVGPVRADNVDELITLLKIREEFAAQHQECIEGALQSLDLELQFEIQSDDLEIEKDDPDWALLAAIYSEYYEAICSYLSGDEIINFYRSEIRKRFTAQEIDALIKFHNTPLGKKLAIEWFEIGRSNAKILKERQSIDEFDAQRQFDRRMEDFWNYRQDKSIGGSREQDA